MRLLLDSHVLLVVIKRDTGSLPASYAKALISDSSTLLASAASLWEIALKARLGKLPLDAPAERLPEILETMGIRLLAIAPEHAVHKLAPLPATKDPFDRMLLAQCRVENLRLVTLDRKLVDHPLAWRSRSA